MAVLSAADVAAELRRRSPDLPVKKLHKLLYYCQGHHLAAFGSPLFAESISAWDMGPVVGQLWFQEKEGTAQPSGVELTEGQLNTIGYVLSRYGRLTGADLERLSHNEPPWLEANRDRRPNSSAKISFDSLRDYFRSATADEDDGPVVLDSEEISAWLAGVSAPTDAPVLDSVEGLRARLGNA